MWYVCNRRRDITYGNATDGYYDALPSTHQTILYIYALSGRLEFPVRRIKMCRRVDWHSDAHGPRKGVERVCALYRFVVDVRPFNWSSRYVCSKWWPFRWHMIYGIAMLEGTHITMCIYCWNEILPASQWLNCTARCWIGTQIVEFIFVVRENVFT